MKSILVPTDFSAPAQKAFDYALQIAEKSGASITLLHITDGNTRTTDSDAAVQQQLAAMLQQKGGNVLVRTHISYGSVVAGVLDSITTFAADLVVMGTQGATGFKKVLMGSNTVKVIGAVPVPVLSIPAAYEKTGIKEIVLAIHKANEEEEQLAPLFEIACLFNAHVRLFIFTIDNTEAVTYLTDRRTIVAWQEKLQRLYPNTEVEHLSGTDFQETLQQYLNTHDIDLLAMITHERGMLEGLFNRSMTKEMAYHATLPLLSLKAQRG